MSVMGLTRSKRGVKKEVSRSTADKTRFCVKMTNVTHTQKNTKLLPITNVMSIFSKCWREREEKKNTSKDKTDNGAMTFLSPCFFQQVPNEHVTRQN